MLDVSPNTIYRAIEAGELDAVRIGKSLRISPESLRIYLNTRAESAYQVQAVGQVVVEPSAGDLPVAPVSGAVVSGVAR